MSDDDSDDGSLGDEHEEGEEGTDKKSYVRQCVPHPHPRHRELANGAGAACSRPLRSHCRCTITKSVTTSGCTRIRQLRRSFFYDPCDLCSVSTHLSFIRGFEAFPSRKPGGLNPAVRRSAYPNQPHVSPLAV